MTFKNFSNSKPYGSHSEHHSDQIIDIRYKLTINTNTFILERNVLSFQVLLKISKNINHKEHFTR